MSCVIDGGRDFKFNNVNIIVSTQVRFNKLKITTSQATRFSPDKRAPGAKQHVSARQEGKKTEI